MLLGVGRLSCRYDGLDRPKAEKPPNCRTVFIGNLAFDIDDETLREVLAPCGTIEVSGCKWRPRSAVWLTSRCLPCWFTHSVPFFSIACVRDDAQRLSERGMFCGSRWCCWLFGCGVGRIVADSKAIRWGTEKESGNFRGFGHVTFAEETGVDKVKSAPRTRRTRTVQSALVVRFHTPLGWVIARVEMSRPWSLLGRW